MSALLTFARAMDWVSDRFGKLASWTVLLAAMISAGNAFIRYGIDWSSNGLLEIPVQEQRADGSPIAIIARDSNRYLLAENCRG